MEAIELVRILVDEDSKLPRYALGFEVCYTIGAILITTTVLNESFNGDNTGDGKQCNNWQTSTFYTSDGEEVVGSICTDLVDADNSGNVPLALKNFSW